MNHITTWKLINSFIDQRDNFILTTHISPDGDALGSELALALLLKKLGKQYSIINLSPTSSNYRFLDPEGQIAIYSPEKHLEQLTNIDGVFILDISDWARLRGIGKVIRQLDLPRVCIDHHRPTDTMAEIEIIDTSASCTGELLYDFMTFLNEPCSARIAEALYTCILTDTGSFRFSNTSPRVHQITADLLSIGVNARQIYEQVYETCSQAKMNLMGEVMRAFNYECDGKLAWFIVSRELLQKSGAEIWELETFPEIPKMIAGVEVGLMITEMDRDRTKISLRSKGRIPIIEIAEKFGGGGHKFAAGAVISGIVEQVIGNVISEIKKVVCNYASEHSD